MPPKRWRLDGHELHDREKNTWIINKDKAYVYMFNELYKEIKELQRLVKIYGEGHED